MNKKEASVTVPADIELPTFDTKNGVLMMAQNKSIGGNGELPFDVVRVLVMKDMIPGDQRGGHTHHKTRQILFALSGSCIVDLDTGIETWNTKLDSFNKGILLEPYTWHVMRDFAPGTVLLVLADTEYDEKDYIRDYDEFLTCIQ